MVTSGGQGHHHRSTVKHGHKSFKSKHATKGSLKVKAKGKLEDFEKGQRKTAQQQVLSKIDRKNKAKQKQLLRHQQVLRANKLFDGRKGAPRIIAVIPLCSTGTPALVVRKLNAALDIDVEIPESGVITVPIDRFKQKLQYIIPADRDFRTALDACKVADFVIFILSAVEEVDEYGETLLRSIESQGISNVSTVVQDLDYVKPEKRRPDVKKSLNSYIQHFFPAEEKIFDTSNIQECSNLIRSLCTQLPKGIVWRDARSYMLAEEVTWAEDVGQLVVSGVVRGKGFKADRLVHLPGQGDFQIEKICAYPESKPTQQGEDSMMLDDAPVVATGEVLDTPTHDQDDLAELAPDAVGMEDDDDNDTVPFTERKGVLLDDHHYFEEKEGEEYKVALKLPKGTSEYQSAWYLEDVSDASDVESDDDDEMELEGGDAPRPEDGLEGRDLDGRSMRDPTEFGDNKSEMFLDPSPEQEYAQIEEFRNRQKEAEEDLEFPDEIELHPNALARERLAKYRGLKSLRSSVWDTREDKPYMPSEYPRLLRIENYKGTKNKILSEALVGGVPAGTRVQIFIRNAPRHIVNSYNPAKPFPVYSLLRHEHKHSVVHYTLTPNSEFDTPLKAKEPLILSSGPRTLQINPLYSQPGNTPNNVHKFEKFLQPGRTTLVTFTGPIQFGSVPALFFQPPDTAFSDPNSPPAPKLIGTGSFHSVDTQRITAKRIVLTGHPYKIHKKVVTVRYMFFNKEDVDWFKALQLFTKRGRTGYIKESLGTHGYFKANFDGKINPQDAVAISLYKRVWPRPCKEIAL